MTSRVLMIIEPGNLFMAIVSLEDSVGTSSNMWVSHSRIGLVSWAVNGKVVRQ